MLELYRLSLCAVFSMLFINEWQPGDIHMGACILFMFITLDVCLWTVWRDEHWVLGKQ